MKAIKYQGNKSFEVQEVAEQDLKPNEVQIAPEYVGLCGTDLHVYLGDMDHRVGDGAIIGHEMSGRVVAIGKGVTLVKPGDKVTVLPTRFCGECVACQGGAENVCYNMDFIGLDSPGALQQRWNVPENLVIPLPDKINLRQAALIEPLTVAVHDVNRSDLQPAEVALVVGGGPIGLLIALVAKARGAKVLLSEPASNRREAAEHLGIKTVDPTIPQALNKARKSISRGGYGFDVVFEVSGAGPGISSAIENVAARGRIIQVGIHASHREIDLHAFFWREIGLYGARLYHKEDMVQAAQLIAEGKIPVEKFISGVLPMSKTVQAFETLSKGSAMKLLIQITD